MKKIIKNLKNLKFFLLKKSNKVIMKCLIVFYSRKGTTKKVAKIIADKIECELEEIIDTKNRMGFIGWLKAGFDATREKFTVIKDIKKNPELYDLAILGTPVWNRRVPPPIRTFIAETKPKLKKVAFFCTEGGRGGPQVFEMMENLCGIKPISTLELNKKEIKAEIYIEKIESFINEIQ
jgi:flavodoxin